jgi:DNA-binding CsgD family transcriptional regulator
MAVIRARLAQGHSPTDIARDMGVSRGTVYKARTSV